MAQSLRGAKSDPSQSEADRVSAGLQRALHAAARPAAEPVHLAECGHCGSQNGLSASRCWHCGGDLQVSRPGEPEQFFAAIVDGAADAGGAHARPPPWRPPSAAPAPSRPQVRRPAPAVAPRRGRAPSGGVLLLGVVVVAASVQGISYYFNHDTEVDPAAARAAQSFAAAAPAAAPASASDAVDAHVAAALERADRAIAGTPAAAQQPAPEAAAAVAALEPPAPAPDPTSTDSAQALAPPAPAVTPPRASPPLIVAQRDPGKPADAWPAAAAVVAAAAARARSGATPPAPTRATSCNAALAALSLCASEPAAKGDAR